jgi:hypothetical protein
MGIVIKTTCYLTLTACCLLSVTVNAMAQPSALRDSKNLSYSLKSPVVLSENEDPPPKGGPKGSDSGGSRWVISFE